MNNYFISLYQIFFKFGHNIITRILVIYIKFITKNTSENTHIISMIFCLVMVINIIVLQ